MLLLILIYLDLPLQTSLLLC